MLNYGLGQVTTANRLPYNLSQPSRYPRIILPGSHASVICGQVRAPTPRLRYPRQVSAIVVSGSLVSSLHSDFRYLPETVSDVLDNWGAHPGTDHF